MASPQQQMPQMEAEKMKLVQDLEIEMMTDMYARLTSACHKKCIAPKYREAELQKGESVCIDRCVAKVRDPLKFHLKLQFVPFTSICLLVTLIASLEPQIPT